MRAKFYGVHELQQCSLSLLQWSSLRLVQFSPAQHTKFTGFHSLHIIVIVDDVIRSKTLFEKEIFESSAESRFNAKCLPLRDLIH